jgi:pilus assembly protein CpaF
MALVMRVDDTLVKQLVREVAVGLTDQRDTGDGPAGAMSDELREPYAAHLLRASLARIERDRLVSGLVPLTGDYETELERRVRSVIFGASDFEDLMADPDIENVFLNGPHQTIIVRRDGSIEYRDGFASSNDELNEKLTNLAATQGRTERRFDTGHPVMSIRLKNGCRLSAVRDLSGHTVVAIRRHGYLDIDMAKLHELGTISRILHSLLPAVVRGKLNVLVTGGTNAGKTTFLRGLINEIPADERLITIEDTLELHLADAPERHPNVVEMETREPNVDGRGEFTMRDLTRQALRLSPDRLLIGEVRGPEVLDMLQAMSQGNDGSIGTLHARSSKDAFIQILRYGLRSPEQLSPEAIAVDVAACLDLVIHLAKLPDGRRVVASVREVTGFHGAQVASNEVFAPDRHGRAVPTPTGFTDDTRDRLAAAGFTSSPAAYGPDGGWGW